MQDLLYHQPYDHLHHHHRETGRRPLRDRQETLETTREDHRIPHGQIASHKCWWVSGAKQFPPKRWDSQPTCVLSSTDKSDSELSKPKRGHLLDFTLDLALREMVCSGFGVNNRVRARLNEDCRQQKQRIVTLRQSVSALPAQAAVFTSPRLEEAGCTSKCAHHTLRGPMLKGKPCLFRLSLSLSPCFPACSRLSFLNFKFLFPSNEPWT